MKIMTLNAKCDDRFSIEFEDERGTSSHQGYVPHDLGIGGGDYVKLRINAETGQILDWTPLTLATFEDAIEDE